MRKRHTHRNYHHGDLEKALIDAGLEILEETGAKGLSLRQVARRAGVSHTAPYRHYKNKEALLGAIAMEGFKLLTACLERRIAMGKGDSRKELVEAGIAYYELAMDYPEHLKVMFSCDCLQDTAIHSKSIPPEYDAFKVLEDIFIRGQEKGVFTKEHSSRALALAVWSSVHGFVSLILEGQMHAPRMKDFDPQETLKEICQLHFVGMKA